MVRVIQRGDGDPRLRAHLDVPQAGDSVPARGLRIGGWAVGTAAPVRHVFVAHRRNTLVSAPVDGPRPDVAAALGNRRGADRSGFSLEISLRGLPPRCRLDVGAELTDGGRPTVAELHVARPTRAGPCVARRRPLLVNAIGRSGSTWLLRLLAEHPEILVRRQYPYECNVLSWCGHAALVLAAPATAAAAAAHHTFADDRTVVGPAPANLPSVPPRVADWLGDGHWDALRRYVGAAADGFYAAVAADQDEPDTTCVAEKVTGVHTPWVAREIWADVREAFLVRDPRDVFCSMRAFNARRGFPSFGEGETAPTADWLTRFGEVAEEWLFEWTLRRQEAHLVRYEQLVREPDAALGALCAYFGVADGANVIAGVIARARAGEAELAGHRTSPTAERSIGRWRRELSAAQARAVHSALAPVLAGFGYEG